MKRRKLVSILNNIKTLTQNIIDTNFKNSDPKSIIHKWTNYWTGPQVKAFCYVKDTRKTT